MDESAVTDCMLKISPVFGTNITAVKTRDFKLLASCLARDIGKSVYFCNVHMLMLSQEDSALGDALARADYVFADGVPVAWLQRKLSSMEAKVVRGYELMLAICEYAALKGENVGLLGSTEGVMNGLAKNLSDQFKELNIEYQYCPPFQEDEVVLPHGEMTKLKDAQIKWLFVGLGCPKQEKWIARYRSELEFNVLGVGAAFDWLSGLTRKPPIWMEKFALGWLFRLVINPRKMWHRYLTYNTKFILQVPGELYRAKKTRKQQVRM